MSGPGDQAPFIHDHANRVLDRCASTNDLARELGEAGAPHGTWVSARAQDQGRGRLGREWRSLEGNLFLSLVARIEDKSRWTWVPLATAVAVARWAEAAGPRFAPLAHRLRIKWPNDLWVVEPGAPPGAPGDKLGGILCEAVGNRAGSFLVIGLGLNCAHAPEGLDQRTTSITRVCTGERAPALLGNPRDSALVSDAPAPASTFITADDLRPALVAELTRTMSALAAHGPAAIVADYERRAAFPPGSGIEWESAGRARHGIVRQLGQSGELEITTAEGEPLKLYAEDVRVRPAR